MPQQSLFDFVGLAVGAVGRGGIIRIDSGQSKYIPDDSLGFFVDTECVAGDLTSLEGRIAGEHVVVEILHEQLGGGAVIPVQALQPEFALGIEYRSEDRCSKVPQVEDLNGKVRCHLSSHSTGPAVGLSSIRPGFFDSERGIRTLDLGVTLPRSE